MPDPSPAGQQALELAPEVGEVCSSGARFEVGDEIGRRQRCTLGPAAVDLPRPALETMAGDRVADLAAGGLAETGSPFGVAQAVEDKKRAAFAPTLGVTAAVIVRPAKGLTTPESLATPGRGLRFLRILRDACRHHGGGQTVRRLRPLRRRRERTLRPFLVLIRSRKPCVFLRRRLLG